MIRLLRADGTYTDHRTLADGMIAALALYTDDAPAEPGRVVLSSHWITFYTSSGGGAILALLVTG